MKRQSTLCFVFSIVFFIVALALLYSSFISNYHDNGKLATLLEQSAWTTAGVSVLVFFAALGIDTD